MKLNRFSSFLIGLVVSTTATGMVSFVNAAGNASIIYSCVNKSSQVIRYVPKKRCSSNESSLSWNVSGPQGPEGSQGLQGPRGIDGDDGTRGENGTAGAKGETGRSGVNGVDGTNGLPGARGETGVPGTNGSNGTPGTNGAPGANGTPGADGAPGANGAPGTNGTGSFVAITTVTIPRSTQSIDDLPVSGFTTVSTAGTSISVAAGCGTQSVSSSATSWSAAIKAPTGSTIIGLGDRTDSVRIGMVNGTADGTLQRLSAGGTAFNRTNSEFYTINIFGPLIAPVQLNLQVILTGTSCTVSGSMLTV